MATLEPSRRKTVLGRLREWQEGWYLRQIGPHFGLSWDYDQFILSVAPPFVALLAGLLRNVEGAAAYLLRVCDALVPKDATPRRRDIVVYNALWTAHIAVAADDAVLFARAMEIVSIAGVPLEEVLVPPGHLNLDEPERLGTEPKRDAAYPEMASFSEAARSRIALQIQDDPLQIAVGVLMSEMPANDWSPQIVWMLHRLPSEADVVDAGEPASGARTSKSSPST